jgi:hypothetical protein
MSKHLFAEASFYRNIGRYGKGVTFTVRDSYTHDAVVGVQTVKGGDHLQFELSEAGAQEAMDALWKLGYRPFMPDVNCKPQVLEQGMQTISDPQIALLKEHNAFLQKTISIFLDKYLSTPVRS